MAASTPEPSVSRRSVIGAPEALVQILLRAVRKHGDDDAALEPPGDVEHRGDRRARRDAREQAFLTRQSTHHPVRALRFNPQILVGERWIVYARHPRPRRALPASHALERPLRPNPPQPPPGAELPRQSPPP